MTHQYIDRLSGSICTEPLFGDGIIRTLYDPIREKAPAVFRALTSAQSSRLLAAFNYDLALSSRIGGNRRFLREAGLDLDECVDPPESLNTARKVFERKIRYWECRPMAEIAEAVVSPADARVLVGNLDTQALLFIKDKFFDLSQLLGSDKGEWIQQFQGGDFAIFRLTPDKYHYNHTPVAGRVVDLYEVDGTYHSCNPQAVVTVVTPYSKNKRVVTIIDTDVPGGTRVGKVAMVEVVALMIGGIQQAYSRHRYDNPTAEIRGQFVEKGCPKSLYRPGSSTDVLLFEPGRIEFAPDLIQNQLRRDAVSRFSRGFTQPLVETDIAVRSFLALPRTQTCRKDLKEVHR